MTTITQPRARAAALAVLLPTAGLAVGVAAPASAVDDACPGDWTLVPGTDDVCSLTVTTSGSVTVPADVTSLQALLVGGGAGSLQRPQYQDSPTYAGGGGQVAFVEELALPQNRVLAIEIGAGGTGSSYELDLYELVIDSSAVPAGDTTLTSGGVQHVGAGGQILNPFTSFGLGVDPDPDGDPFAPSAYVAFASPASVGRWPAYENEPLVSGAGEQNEQMEGDDPICPSEATGAAPAGAPGTGRGATGPIAYRTDADGLICQQEPGDGGSGVVILRGYLAGATPSPSPTSETPGTATPPASGSGSGALPATGSSPAGPLAAATVLLAAGMTALGLSRRARRQR